ncbi:hypothetical protein Tco_1441512, partial [Tanacetum coccineum]
MKNQMLWYALGKLKAERVSGRIAEEKGLKLATICSGLITGPRYFCTNPSSTIAYLKGDQDMYEQGLLATVNADKLGEIGGLDSLTLNSLYDEGAYRASQQPVYGSPAPNLFEAAGCCS